MKLYMSSDILMTILIKKDLTTI